MKIKILIPIFNDWESILKLLENIIKLGNIGDKVKVKPGYGRNFLLKTGKALRFNKENQIYVSKKKMN